MKARGYADFSALLWAGILIGLVLGGCIYCAASYVSPRMHVEWTEPAR